MIIVLICTIYFEHKENYSLVPIIIYGHNHYWLIDTFDFKEVSYYLLKTT